MSTTASYIRHGRGRSFNAEAAMENGRYPASYIAKSLGKGCTAAFVKEHSPHSGEWHHVGKFASEVEFYDRDECSEWFATPEAQEKLAAAKAAAKLMKSAPPAIADVVIEEWERVAINRFGKLAWRKRHVVLTERTVTMVGSEFIEIAGYGKKNRKHVTLTILDAATITARKRRRASLKAAATRKARAAEAAKVANVPAFTAALMQCVATAEILRLPRFGLAVLAPTGGDADSILRRYSLRWRAEGRGAVHPAPPEVMEAKTQTGLSWSEIQNLANQ